MPFVEIRRGKIVYGLIYFVESQKSGKLAQHIYYRARIFTNYGRS